MVKMIIWDLIGVVWQNDQIDPKARELIKDFNEMEIRSSTISNTFPELIKKVAEELGLDPALSTIEIGLSKRDSEIYKYFLEKAGLKPQECLMIDDHKKNLYAAKQLGMTTVFFSNNKREYENIDHVISDLDDLMKIVQSL